MPINPRIVELVDKGLAGQGLEEAETAELLAVNPYTAEGSHVRWGGWMLSRKASNGVAEVHAQIGMDASACHKNCGFCSFAACNGLRKGKLEMPPSFIRRHHRAAHRYELSLAQPQGNALVEHSQIAQVRKRPHHRLCPRD